jgi:hypothetical protein
MDFYQMYETDKDKEKNGVPYLFADGMLRITLARAGGGNTKFARILAANSKPYKRAIQNEQISDEKANDLMMKTYAEAVVTNWETEVAEEDGAKVFKKGIRLKGQDELQPVNIENIVAVWKMLPDLFSDIMAEASKLSNYMTYQREEDTKN